MRFWSKVSQLDPLPRDLPFRIVSKTVGRGAYASIKKAIPLDSPTPVFAVKLIHKGYATKQGRISAKQLAMEVSLHSHIGQHPNVIEWFASGEDPVWRWIAMEFAEGGDLFDKIEADVGVRQDIAQLYFIQLVGGVSFMHSKGVAHRDLKPENILLSAEGSLKLADFGMATMFEYKGQRKTSSTLCGSPPYIAPEILACGRAPDRKAPGASKYSPDLADLWSCGVILFVLLVGNTPWDEPSPSSWEFSEYTRNHGHSTDALFQQVRQHPWYTRHNPLLTADGKVSDPIHLATQMLENLRVDFSQRPSASQRQAPSVDDMDVDTGLNAGKFSSTQPETPITDKDWDWEQPVLRSMAMPASSFPRVPPTPAAWCSAPSQTNPRYARGALHQLNVPLGPVSPNLHGSPIAQIKVKAVDGRQQSLHGEINIDKQPLPDGTEVLDVRFVKIKGDPLEWRRFFKKVVVLCKDGVYVPES
ncbi:hypothetical protein ACCO45_007112 [Purpureocillium lilacinum]|uniref:Uncharacterized protein n=1 Tax=Purpureocillium lilacinum TaxID=33203 RepID=A0ACC4DRE4_PURLI